MGRGSCKSKRELAEVGPPRPGPSPQLYFVHPFVDIALVGGASILVLLLVTQLHSGERTANVLSLAAFLTWLVNWPHFSATSFRLYGSRDAFAQYPFTAVLTVLLCATGVAGCITSPDTLAPAFVKLFLIWSPYHFSGQTFGVALLYARRAGIQVLSHERLALMAFIYSTFAFGSVRAEVGVGFQQFYGIQHPSLGVPAWLPSIIELLLWSSALVLALCIVRRRMGGLPPLPLVVYIPPLAQYAWFIAGASTPSFAEFVPFFHGLQYLLIAWAMHMAERVEAHEDRGSTGGLIVWESTKWGLANLVGGACLFVGLPRLVSTWGVAPSFATGVVIAGVQMHHFIVDGVIWKLRSPAVSSPLMTSLSALLRKEGP